MGKKVSFIRGVLNACDDAIRYHFQILRIMGTREGNDSYTKEQKEFAIRSIGLSGVRATVRLLQIPRRTLQRWCREYGVCIKRCPDWVYRWVEMRRNNLYKSN